MHEMSLMVSMLEIIEDQTRIEGFHRVPRVFYEPCAACGQAPREILAGRTMRIVSLDVE
jgi:Zn finger protein HypA/HybF involved in hydrogenase expression